MQQLDHHSTQLMTIFKRKGGAAGQKIRNIMADLDKVLFILFIFYDEDEPAGHKSGRWYISAFLLQTVRSLPADLCMFHRVWC